MAEEAISARRAAVEEVERLLQYPEDLKRLDSLMEEYGAKQQCARRSPRAALAHAACPLQNNKAQLGAAVAAQVESMRAGLEMLGRAHQALLRMRENFATIDALCVECQSLIDCHDKIRALSAVHYNLRKTLQDVENIAALPVEAAEAEEMLQDDRNLLQAYECLAMLEGTSMKAQRSLESGTHVNLQEAKNLNSYFQKASSVKQTMGKFEERLWSIIRNFLAVSREDPGLLVVELQEMVDVELLAAGQPASPLRKAWRRRALQQIENAVQERFAPLLQRCSQLIAAGENTDQRVTEILGAADELVVQYHRQLGSMIDFIGLCADNLANSDILKVMEWIYAYQDSLAGLGVEEADVAFPTGPQNGMSLLVGKYVERTVAMLSAWLKNIVDGDFRFDPKESADGKVWTPGAVDFFRILNEQVAVVAEVNRDEMLLRVGEAAVDTMLDFQSAQRRHMSDGLPLEMLCAVVNNNVRCYNESLEFADRLEETFTESARGQLDIEDACRGFLTLAKEAVATLVAVVFSDPGFAELFPRLYCSDEWRAGGLTASVVATLDDFLSDFNRMVEPSFFRRRALPCWRCLQLPQLHGSASGGLLLSWGLSDSQRSGCENGAGGGRGPQGEGAQERVARVVAEALLEETVAHYMAALLSFLRGVSDDDLGRVRRDDARLREFFARFTKPEKVARECQVLTDISEFLASDSVEAFVLSYSTLLQSSPGITPTLLANLLNARASTDKAMTKADVREILEQCREVYADRQASDDSTLVTEGGRGVVVDRLH
eukprot:scaffold16.g4.t1